MPTSKEISTEIDLSLVILLYLKIAVCYLIYKHGDEAFVKYRNAISVWCLVFNSWYVWQNDVLKNIVNKDLFCAMFPLYMPEIHGNMWRLNMIKLGNKQHPEFERAKNYITQRAGEIVKNYIPNEKMKNLVTAKPNVNHFLEDGGALWIYLAKMPVGLKLFLWSLN